MTLPGMAPGQAKPQAGPGTLNYPYGLAVDSAGNLYAANVFGGVNIYSSSDNFKLTATVTEGLSYPAAVSIAFGGDIYVANNGGDNITIYNPALQQIGTIWTRLSTALTVCMSMPLTMFGLWMPPVFCTFIWTTAPRVAPWPREGPQSVRGAHLSPCGALRMDLAPTMKTSRTWAKPYIMARACRMSSRAVPLRPVEKRTIGWANNT